MSFLNKLRFWSRLARPNSIARRYFVTNGFDGALTMLGLNMGFYVSKETDLHVIISACLGAAVALGMSGLTSAYVSESAERKRALRELEQAMVMDLGESDHAKAARLAPLLVALVNGSAPLLISLVITVPLWLGHAGVTLMTTPVEAAIMLAFAVLFLLGVFLGRVSSSFWLWSGLRTLAIGVITAIIIFVLGLAP